MLPSPTHSAAQQMLCCYVNATAHVEIVRITNIPHWFFERSVFPGQRLIFNAPAKAKLEIHSGISITAIVTETIDCQELQLSTTIEMLSTQSA